jgi:hypothetical protein
MGRVKEIWMQRLEEAEDQAEQEFYAWLEYEKEKRRDQEARRKEKTKD